jgi:hypothetical protein
MAKHRRLIDNHKDDSVSKEEQAEFLEQKSSPIKIPKDLKSILQSGTKYAYIIIAAALLSGIFTPLTIGEEVELVLYGMFSIFIGLGGGIVIFLGLRAQKFSSLIICGGLGMFFGSLILIHELAERSLFW